jgi:hypothetical protein
MFHGLKQTKIIFRNQSHCNNFYLKIKKKCKISVSFACWSSKYYHSNRWLYRDCPVPSSHRRLHAALFQPHRQPVFAWNVNSNTCAHFLVATRLQRPSTGIPVPTLLRLEHGRSTAHSVYFWREEYSINDFLFDTDFICNENYEKIDFWRCWRNRREYSMQNPIAFADARVRLERESDSEIKNCISKYGVEKTRSSSRWQQQRACFQIRQLWWHINSNAHPLLTFQKWYDSNRDDNSHSHIRACLEPIRVRGLRGSRTHSLHAFDRVLYARRHRVGEDISDCPHITKKIIASYFTTHVCRVLDSNTHSKPSVDGRTELVLVGRRHQSGQMWVVSYAQLAYPLVKCQHSYQCAYT